MRFVSARDGMYNGVFWTAFLVAGGLGLSILLGPSTRGDRLAVVFLLLPVSAMMGLIYFRTFYEVTEDRLIIHFGPFWQTLKRDRISSIKTIRNFYSAPALSRDRLQIRYDTYGEVQISPKDQAGFLKAMGFSLSDTDNGQGQSDFV
jgi:Bacterial PH domain